MLPNPVLDGFQFIKDFISCLPVPIIAFINLCLTMWLIGLIWSLVKGLH